MTNTNKRNIAPWRASMTGLFAVMASVGLSGCSEDKASAAPQTQNASASSPQRSQRDNHPLSQLTYYGTNRKFSQPDGTFTLVVFMTAQQLYPSCGGVFLNTNGLLNVANNPDNVQKILVMPDTQNQSNPNDRRNLEAAERSGFTVLTGSLSEVNAAAISVGTRFEVNANDQVINHSLSVFGLWPNGQIRFSDNFARILIYARTLNEDIQVCSRGPNDGFCL